MLLRTTAIVCAILVHGEHGVVARLLTPENGLMAGYVRGGRSRRMRPVLQPGNRVEAEFRARTEDQLAGLTLELTESRSGLHAEPLAAQAIEWATALTAGSLPEGHAYPRLHAALDGLLGAIAAAPSARRWAAALVRYELLMLSELGFGLDLERCAVTGRGVELAYVSPRSGRAVSSDAGEAYREQLFPLPAFLTAGGPADDWEAVFDGLAITGHFLERDLIDERRTGLVAARQRLVERMRQAV